MVTPFQQRVYEATQRIPKGKVTTYKLLAEAIGCGSPRAIGQALRCNPYAPTVPCHRVISSDLTIGGFYGATAGHEIDKKLTLLASEGVHFAENYLADPESLFRF